MEASLISRLEKAIERLEELGVQPSNGSVPADQRSMSEPAASAPQLVRGTSSALSAWDQLLIEHLGPVKALARDIPPQAQQSMEDFKKAFEETRRVLEVAKVAKKPESAAELQSLLAPVAEAMGAVNAAAEGRVACPNHLKALSEAVGALGFLAYTGHGCAMNPPRQFVADSWQSAEFYFNKLLISCRGVDERQIAWAKALKALVQQLEQFVVENCATGLRFNPNGVPLAEAMRSVRGTAPTPAPAPAPAQTGPSKPAGVRPPPPPPPGPPPRPLSPEELAASAPAATTDKGPGRGGGGGGGCDTSALFKELCKGEGITAGLRKVTADMKTKDGHQRVGAVPVASTTMATTSSASQQMQQEAAGGVGATTALKKRQPSGPPRLELMGSKWVVENFTGRQDLVVENTSPKNSVYVYGCTDCVVQVQGKVNAITLDNCRRVGAVFGDVICSVEAVNCISVQLQTTGTVATISVEKTDGAQLYLSQQCASEPSFQIVSAKCSSINVVVVPADGDPSDPLEHPVPEQFISTFQSGKLVTVAAEHSGA